MFLLDRLDERETLYAIDFTKICQKFFLYTKWNTKTCEASMKLAIFNSSESFYSFYPNLPKLFFIHKMNKNKAHNGNEHLLRTQNGKF